MIPSYNLPILTSTTTAAPTANYTTPATSFTVLTTYKVPTHIHYNLVYLTILDSRSREMMNYSKGTAGLCLDSIV